ncbi:hypothetical protein [Paenibacillus sp. NPDC055715]
MTAGEQRLWLIDIIQVTEAVKRNEAYKDDLYEHVAASAGEQCPRAGGAPFDHVSAEEYV